MRAIGVDSPGGGLGGWNGPVVQELPDLLELV